MKKISQIYVRLPNWVGDVCMSVPSLKMIQDTGLSITICGKGWANDIISGLGNYNFIELQSNLLKDIATIRSAFKKQNIGTSIGIIFPNSISSSIVFFAAGISSSAYENISRNIFLENKIYRPKQDIHKVNYWLNLTFQSLNYYKLYSNSNYKIYNTEFTLLDKQVTSANKIISDIGIERNKFILISPTATGLHKNKSKIWPWFNELTILLKAIGYSVFMCPPKNEISMALEIAPEAKIIPSVPLGVFAAIMKQAKLVICNDSGASHIASAMLCNQITIFGVTDPKNTGPLSNKAEIVGSKEKWPSLLTVFNKTLHLLKNNCY